MNPVSTGPAALAALLEDLSLEMTAKDVLHLEQARGSIPAGTRINVTFLGNENAAMRRAAARAVRHSGFVPVPHISARRLTSPQALEEYLAALQADGTGESVFVVGGDPVTPHGPYDDSLAIIRSGLLQHYGVQQVGVSGYPEGHPAIAGPVLWAALEEKVAALAEQGLPGCVITQFGFAVDPVLSWVEEVRSRGVPLPVRIGVPGPAGVGRLLRYAARFGVGTSAGIARKYGLSLTNLMGTAGPGRFIRELAEGYDAARHGEIKLHFYTFGGLRHTAEWISDFRRHPHR